MDRNHIIAAVGTLFLVMNPPGNAAVVKGLLQQLPEKRRTRVLVRELCFMLLLLLFFFFLGKELLGWMGISSSSLNLNGSIMLFINAVGMVFPTRTSAINTFKNTELFIVPVTVPIIVGPSAISLVMMQAALCTGPIQKTEGLAAILLAWAGAAIFLGLSRKLLDFLGEKGTTAITRLMGTLLILLAVQMVLNGITAYLKSLPEVLR